MNAKELGQELAHPHVELNECSGKPCSQHFGLTKREYFAAMALAGLAAGDPIGDFNKAAIYALDMADALLTELSREQ